MATYAPVSDPRYFYLKDFQSKRLRDTYGDLAEQKAYKSACFFFFNRLYSTEDTADRDASFRKIYANVKRFLGGEIVASMAKLIELAELTDRLDMTLLGVLEKEGAPVEFDMETYERAYRLSDNYDDRILQIELLVFTNRLIHKISHRFGIGMGLRALRTACLVTGDTRMVDFLMDGYRAFADLRRIEPLVDAIDQRERERLDRIYGISAK